MKIQDLESDEKTFGNVLWFDVPCPQCQAKIQTVNKEAVRYIRLPRVVCSCGFDGPLEWANPHLAVSLDQERTLLVNRKKRDLFEFLVSSNNFEYLQSVVCRAAMKMGKEQKRDPNCVCSEFERLIEICCQQFGIDLDNPKEII